MSFSSIKVHSLQRFSLNFSANVIAGFWLLLGSVKALLWVKPSFAQFLCFLLLALLSNILFSWLVSQVGGQLNMQGLIGYLVWPTLLLLVGVVLARRSQNHALALIPVVLWLTVNTMLTLCQSLIQFLIVQNLVPAWGHEIAPILFLILFVWQTISVLVVFTKQLKWTWWERLLMSMGVVFLLSVWQKNMENQSIFKVETRPPIIDEVAFYEQPTLLSNALSAISKGNLGKSEWYFMGVAGYADQDVFANEIDAAWRLFDVRFGTMGRSVALINNQHTWQNAPIASRTSIAKTLKKIGEQMNGEEDVLFLTIATHGIISDSGAPTRQLALSNPPLSLQPIDGKWLKEALDDSGIRWRVIVLSACYAGGLIDELSSPTTVIITASSAQKASFGCTHEAQFTYFGQAFFAQSLRNSKSFESAFMQTKRRISEKEALLGFEASEPQLVIGSLMQTALPAFEKTLFDNGLQTGN